MPRTVEITLPPQESQPLIEEIQKLDGVLGVRLERGVSLHPPGDVLTALVTNRALHPLMRLLDARGIGRTSQSSVTLSEPAGIVCASSGRAITRDSTDTVWEEMELTLGKESNMTPSALGLMAICGVMASAGIATGALLIAPGFEPITRISLGLATRSPGWRRGLGDTLAGYLALLAGAVAGSLVFVTVGKSPLSASSSYLSPSVLVPYWTTPTLSSIVVSAVASIGGALLISTARSILTGGVMVALALVPSAALVAMGAVALDWQVSAKGLLRWGIDAALVVAFSYAVFVLKRTRIQKRTMVL